MRQREVEEVLSIGDIARLTGNKPWTVRRLFSNGHCPEPPRAGTNRAIPRGWLPQVLAALKAQGYPSEIVA